MNGNCERSEMQDKTLADLENGLRKNRINTGFSSIHAVFSQVAPAGVEPTMGESKSPALPLGDGAPVRISIVEFLSFVKQKRFAVSAQSVLPHFYHVFTVSLS